MADEMEDQQQQEQQPPEEPKQAPEPAAAAAEAKPADAPKPPAEERKGGGGGGENRPPQQQRGNRPEGGGGGNRPPREGRPDRPAGSGGGGGGGNRPPSGGPPRHGGGGGGDRREGGRPGGGGGFRPDGMMMMDIDLEKLIADSLYLDNQAHNVVSRLRDMDSGTKSQLRRFYNAVRRACRTAEGERQHEFVMLRARLAYTIARHSLRSLDSLEKLLLQVTRKNSAPGYERFRDLFEAIVAYNE